MIDLDTPDWFRHAECAGLAAPDRNRLFFPTQGQSTAPGKAICNQCDARTECLEYALDNHECYGIWGGRSERERRAMRHNRRLQLSVVS